MKILISFFVLTLIVCSSVFSISEDVFYTEDAHQNQNLSASATTTACGQIPVPGTVRWVAVDSSGNGNIKSEDEQCVWNTHLQNCMITDQTCVSHK